MSVRLTPHFEALVLLIAACITVPKASAQVTHEAVIAACARQTLVMNQSGEQVGRRVDAYCRGFLDASYSGVLLDLRITCQNSQVITPDFLLSIYQTYVSAFPPEPQEAAAQVVRFAFERAMSCKSK